MTTDRNNPEAIRQDLQRWRDMLKRDIDQEALRELIDDAEKRLAQIEGRTEAH
jgi:chemotaxis regulatin CheY-phosphate phosphatase CheZ